METKKENQKNVLLKILSGLSFVIMLMWLYSALVSENFYLPGTPRYLSLILFSLFSGTMGYFLWIKRVLRKKIFSFCTYMNNQKSFVFLAMIVYQLVVLLFSSTMPGFDVGFLFNIVRGNVGFAYLQMNPNNFLLFLLYNAVRSLVLMQFLNAIAINTAIILLYRFAKRFYSRKVADISFFFFVLLLGMTPWLLIPYSDTLPLPLVIGVMYLCRLHKEKPKKLYLGVTSGVLSAVIYLLKPSAIIFLMAFFIMVWFEKLAIKKKIIDNLAMLFSFFFGLMTVLSVWSVYTRHQNHVHLDPDLAVPPTHFIMMGLYGTGGFNSGDVERTVSVEGREARVEMNIEEIQNRLRAFGFMGYARFLGGKFYRTMEDGTLGWGNEGNFLIYENLNDKALLYHFVNSGLGRVIQSFVYPEGRFAFVYRFIAQIVWIVLIIGLLLSIVFTKKYSFEYEWQLLALFGAILFLMIFESGRSRYLIQFLPTILLLSSRGFESLFANSKESKAIEELNRLLN